MDENLSKIIDKKGRESIVTDLNKNLFVIAGAGSGKTSMLVNRMVAMVEGGTPVNQICAITFTKKAAAEFLDRFQKRLIERSNNPFEIPTKSGDLPQGDEITAQRCKEALKNIDLCFTGTIDSFCNLILSEYPTNANIPSSSIVIEDEDLIESAKNIYTEISYGSDEQLRKKFEIFTYLHNDPAQLFANSIKTILDLSVLDIVYDVNELSIESFVEKLNSQYIPLIQKDFEKLAKLESDVYISNRSGPNQFAAKDAFSKFHKRCREIFSSTISGHNFIDIVNDILKLIGDLRFNNDTETEFIIFGHPKAKGDFQFDKKEGPFAALLAEIEQIKYNYTLDFLVSIVNLAKEKLREKGLLTFGEYLRIFVEMVKDDMAKERKLINHIRQKYSYFLLDESQDTSPLQTELFLYLCSKNKASSIEECSPYPGSLFIVGDPKQSIYGFRGADIDSYLNTKELFLNKFDKKENGVIELTKNFRSNYELCYYFNKRFEGFPNYEPIPLEDKINDVPEEFQGEVLSGVYDMTSSYIDVIESIVGKHYIYDSKKRCKRLIEYKDIMLLTAVTTKHEEILNDLKEHNIPVYCEGKFFLSSAPIFKVICSVYGYLVDEPGELLNLLSSGAFNISPSLLAGIKSKEDIDNEEIKQILTSFESMKGIENPVILLEEIFQYLKLFELVIFDDLQYFEFALEKFKEAYSSDEIIDKRTGYNYLKSISQKGFDRSCNLQYVPNAINLANVHKVKGLEKPIVILYDEKGSSGSDKLLDYKEKKSYLFYLKNAKFYNLKEISCGSLYEDKIKLAEEKNKEEHLRLVYVAVTRARNVLFVNGRESYWESARLDNGIMKLFPKVYTEPPSFKGVESFDYPSKPHFNSKESYWEKKPSKERRIPNRFKEEEFEVSLDDIDSKIKGTLVHRLMEILINSKGSIPEEILIEKVLSEYSLAANVEMEDILRSVYKTIMNGGYPQMSDVEKDLLSIAKACETYTEIPFSYKDGKKLWQGNIDLLYIKDGKYIIVDYKTNFEEEGLEEEYESQLKAYKDALKATLNVDAEAYIYHIDINKNRGEPLLLN